MQIEPIRTFYLPSGRVILSKTSDDYLIESTEMRISRLTVKIILK